MIHFNFGLSNPFCTRWNTVYYRERLFANNKGGEIQIVKDNTIASFTFHFTTRTDHAGISLELGLFGYSVMLQYYDTRHWNEKENRYYIYDSKGNAR
jgi:hypothetical protein